MKAIEAKDEPEAKPTVQMAEKCKCIIYNDEDSKAKLFEYDRCFSADEPQSAVFEEAAPLSTSVLDGYNVCIFAYGQTGSGKTHTMQAAPPVGPAAAGLVALRSARRQNVAPCHVAIFKRSLRKTFNPGIL